MPPEKICASKCVMCVCDAEALDVCKCNFNAFFNSCTTFDWFF
jgi:hypothetical protein